MDLKLAGKVFVVTGASDGLGAATARRLGEEGARERVRDSRPSASPRR